MRNLSVISQKNVKINYVKNAEMHQFYKELFGTLATMPYRFLKIVIDILSCCLF